MNDWLPTLLAVVVCVAAACYAGRPRYVFVVQVVNGVPKMTTGKVSVAFLREFQEVCKDAQFSHGWVAGTRNGKRTTLVFSRTVPPPLRQRFRNLWLFHGVSGPEETEFFAS